jgi:type I restriction enzyme S subunit
MPKINQSILADVQVPLPPEVVRSQIVYKLDAAFNLADAIARRLDWASRRVHVSSQAVLTKAFRGELLGTRS